MTPVPRKTIQHFTHPVHPLTEIKENREYLCDGCKTLGDGPSYRCHTCEFDLHEYCGTCPTTLSSFMHPQHQLCLVVRKPRGTRQNDRVCAVCGDEVKGLFYRCELCDFNLHPLCTQFPQFVHHGLHQDHPLQFQPSSSNCCTVCGRSVCSSWHYTCGICSFYLDLECLLKQSDAPNPPSKSPKDSPQPPPPCYGADNGGHHHARGGRTSRYGKRIGRFAAALAVGTLSTVLGAPDFSAFF